MAGCATRPGGRRGTRRPARHGRRSWPRWPSTTARRPSVRERWLRVVLALMVVSSAVVGFWAQLAPRSFYDDFPGGGQHWVSVDGPYNEHLVRDVGGLNLALPVAALVALVTSSR